MIKRLTYLKMNRITRQKINKKIDDKKIVFYTPPNNSKIQIILNYMWNTLQNRPYARPYNKPK